MNVLVFNVGSTTLKYACVDTDTGAVGVSGVADRIGQPDGDAQTHMEAAQTAVADIGWDTIDAIGHRIVQGGSRFTGPERVTSKVLEDLEKLDALAPLHNPSARAVAAGLGATGLPQVLVFDTSYFASLPPEAYRYAVPPSWFHDYGVRKYGFHGTSHEYVTEKALHFIEDGRCAKCISMHLGGGASMTASAGGRAVDTSMGMTPLQGLVMATRSGDVDPAIPLYIAEVTGAKPGDVLAALNRQSGLVGLCGESDMRAILQRRSEGDVDASLAVDVYVRSIVKTVGSYVAILGGLDALVFTAGVGEHSPEIRRLVTEALGHFGVAVCSIANEACLGSLADISSTSSKARILVVPTNEELAIAQKTCKYLAS